MLKITAQSELGGLLLVLEGELAGRSNKELILYWQSFPGTREMDKVRVDLSSVTFIDENGIEVLREMYRQGAEFLSSGCMNNCIVEDIIRSVKREVRR